jgi:hypothetical protein
VLCFVGLDSNDISLSLAGLMFLEMATGAPHHQHSFLGEVEDEFCERQSLSGPEGAAMREILCSIFVSCDATIGSLLDDPFFHVSVICCQFCLCNAHLKPSFTSSHSGC